MSVTVSSLSWREAEVRDLALSLMSRGVSEKTAWEWAEAETPKQRVWAWVFKGAAQQEGGE